MCSNQDNFYLGLDLSSQKLKGIIIDDNLCIVDKQEVDFDVELVEFGTVKGFLQSNSNNSVTAEVSAPVLMWIKALDLLMEKFQSHCLTFFKIKAISGCAQQHGTVYWKKNKLDCLQNPDASITLYEKLKNNFSINRTPVWRDSSTKMYCNLMEHAVGGKEAMAKITGSVCNERFSGPQIMKIVKEKHDVYINTEKICLISNFLCSLFLGKYAPFEIADASGMNLVDIRAKKWHFDLLNCIDAGLRNKLGQIHTHISECGTISEYFCNRYQFHSDCRVFSFTGDNLSSFAGLRANQNTIILSLGTSDTVFLSLTDPLVVQEGHVFCNPVNPNTYLGLLCFKNGSLVRERFCNIFANGSWEIFNNLLSRNEPGNGRYFGLFYDDFEIVPVNMKGDYRYDKFLNRISKFPNAETEIRALVEGQIIAKKYHILNSFNCKIDCNTNIFVTGGASVNNHILQIVSDVFQCKVYQKNEPNSAALGACYIAKFAYDNQLSKIMDCDHCHDNDIIFTPNESYANCYNEMLKQYEKFLNMSIASIPWNAN